MKKSMFILFFVLTQMALYASDSALNEENLVRNILEYGQDGSLKLGQLFTVLQAKYFSIGFLAIAIGVPLIFSIHYLSIGPKVFSHDGKKVYVFSAFNRLIHLMAAISFLVLVPTGFIMIFGSTFGGGTFVTVCKELHVISTILFTVSVFPMLFMWIKDMLPTSYDIKWLMIFGGYLSKEKKIVPIDKFNAGQKMWFWLCTFGGIVMVLTGAALYFYDFKLAIISQIGLSQIDFLRASAIIHNILGMAIVVLFFTHIYMAMFAIKGAIHSIITGYKEEKELEVLNSLFYKKLKEQNKI